jgi:hypothetical protein
VAYTLTGALKATGLDKVTILKAIKDGKVAAAKDLFGEWQIERAALHQAFPPVGERASEGNAVQRCGAPDAPTLEAEIGALIRQAGDSLRGPLADAPEATQAAQGSGRDPEFESLPTDQVGITVAGASVWDHQIGTGSRDDDLRFRVILTTGVLLAAIGFAWIGGLGPYRFFSLSPSYKPLTRSPAPDVGSEHETTRLETGGDAAPSTTSTHNVTPAIARPGRGQESSRGAAQSAGAPTNPIAKMAQLHLASAGPPEAAALQKTKTKILPGPRPVPTPETRPTTVPGWAVREVVGGTAVLDGPNGTLKVTRGNTVPGLGRIDSIVRWGNRWIVATSRGLITTQ